MKKLRVLVILHTDLVPPENPEKKDLLEAPWITEYDVVSTLKKMGHEVQTCGVYSDLKVIRDQITEFKPHIVYNLLEEFDGEALFDQNVVSYLELLRTPYTGNNPRGLILARDKGLTKKILQYHRIKSAAFHAFPKNKKVKLPKNLKFPKIVKCLFEEASFGISKSSIVHNEEKLLERIQYVHEKLSADCIVEDFIEGREFYVGVMGNYRLKTLPVWELKFEKVDNPEKAIYTTKAKFNTKYRKENGIKTQKADITPEQEKKIQNICRRAYKALNLNGYARIDLRMNNEGEVFILEANPNPDIASDDEFALSAGHEGIKYPELLSKILSLGISFHTKGHY